MITLLFLDFTGTLHAWFGWMARVQLLPAVLAVNVAVVAALLVLTLLFGRVYCSVICPLGVFQDVASWAGGKRRKTVSPIPVPCRGCVTVCWRCSLRRWWPISSPSPNCWRLSVPGG